ncbi:cellulose-binding domain-containing protein [Asanoa siamensis]|uniref:Xyloglucanase n=1 Tax=Asanoa siamensis TaxID=926357 RepID=A0ABQ4CUH3_9ACTN|nr:cellulose-binding domain-containing protein [Asanoa siamensis]GIF74953.1 xyloglucanase [Asanoa siamensis]
MRSLRTWGPALAAIVLAAAAVLTVLAPAPALRPVAAPSDAYTWRNVRIDGGGFVPGIVFNPGQRDLIYARTDIGGAYRWNAGTGSWIPLLDWVGWDRWGWNGVLSIAADPVQTNRVYAAVGMYTNSWDPNNGAILRSTDRGSTWSAYQLPFKVGGNMPGRGQGERLAVDPNNGRVLYYGAEGGNGLWRSTDYGVSWAKVTAFPNAGNYAQDPSDPNGYLTGNQGVTWVEFDPSTGSSGSSTRTIYVGVADKQNPVYRSTDAGVTWQRIPDQPTGYLAHKAVIDPTAGFLYIATSDTGGPYDGGKGDVWKLSRSTGAWTRVSPVPSTSADAYYGYSGLTIDRQNPGTLVVATQISWWPDVVFFRTRDGGATWSRVWDYNGYPNRVNRYTMDISANPWLDFNTAPSAPEQTPKLGWMTESLEIDPFDSNRLLYGTGATVYATTNLTAWDTASGTFTVRPMARGLEETAVLDLVSPPSGAPLVSALGDIGGFRHDDLTAVPASFHDTPNLGSNTSLDFAEANPSVMVRVGNGDRAANPGLNRIGVSTDGGRTWYQGQEPGGVTGGGTVAIATDASAVVWSPAGTGVHYSTSRGSSWTASSGIPAGAQVEASRTSPSRFFGLAAGRVYASTDGGRTFTGGGSGLPDDGKLRTVGGDVWVAGSGGLYRSTDNGATFTRLASVSSAVNVGFGKAAPGRSHPAVFVVGTVDGVRGVYRSDDTGGSWVRINDDQHQYGNAGEALTGDPRVFGRVYLGTNGRGILVADRTGPDPTAGPTSSPTATPTAGPTATPTTTPGGCTATYRTTGSWSGGFQGEVTVRNTGPTPTSTWTVTWPYPNGQRITQLWGGDHTQQGATVTVRNTSWNGTLTPNATTTFGFLASGTAATPSTVTCQRT